MESQAISEDAKAVWEMLKEIGRRFEEYERGFKETERFIKEQFQETARSFKDTDRKFEETDRRFKETDRKFDKYFNKVKELDRNWGKLVEALVKPSVGNQFRKWGIPVIGSGQRVERQKDGETIEIDILLTNTDSVIVVEVKTTLNIEKVDEHIEKRLKPFKKFFREYADFKVYGAAAYIYVEEDAHRYAYKKGLFVLTFTTSDMVEIQNDDKFKPVIWG